MYISLRLIPLIGSVVSRVFGTYLSAYGVVSITATLIFMCLTIALIGFYEVGLCHNVVVLKLHTWVESGSYILQWGLRYDSLTIVIVCVVSTISLIVHIYSGSYIANDPHQTRFIAYLSRFTFCILVLVTADNIVQIFLGWEGVGLCSYLLINFWFTRIQANKSAIKAIVVNRVGDIGLVIGMRLITVKYGTTEYSVMFACTVALESIGGNLFESTIIGVGRLVGAIGKSAQIGLQTWLPDAMEGPTPVSALIHAATIVTAGIFRIARCSPIMEYIPNIRSYITLIGGLTSVYAGTIGLVQNDLKRVIAYSTCSQLGYIILCCGLSGYDKAIYHLVNHALFKALLFRTAGSVIHSLSDEQDIRRIGGISTIIPITYVRIIIGSMALIGLPFRTGYYSKDLRLELSYNNYTTVAQLTYLLGIMGVYCTSYYSIRLLYRTFIDGANGLRIVYVKSHESDRIINLPRLALGNLSLMGGWLLEDIRVGFGTSFWKQSLYVYPISNGISGYVDTEIFGTIEVAYQFINKVQYTSNADLTYFSHHAEIMAPSELDLKLLPLAIALLGGCGGLLTYTSLKQSNHIKANNYVMYSKKIRRKSRYIYRNKKWYFDKVYNELVASITLNLGYSFFYKDIDRGILEIRGPTGFVSELYKSTSNLKAFQSSSLSIYISLIVYGVVVLVTAVNFN